MGAALTPSPLPDHEEVSLMASPEYARPRFRVITFDSDGTEYRADGSYATEAGALDEILANDWLHRISGFSVGECACGGGRWYEKNDTRRGVHIEVFFPDEDAAVESLALALGLLAPASHRDGLEVVL
jgi:hypothetical protein